MIFYYVQNTYINAEKRVWQQKEYILLCFMCFFYFDLIGNSWTITSYSKKSNRIGQHILINYLERLYMYIIYIKG